MVGIYNVSIFVLPVKLAIVSELKTILVEIRRIAMLSAIEYLSAEPQLVLIASNDADRIGMLLIGLK